MRERRKDAYKKRHKKSLGKNQLKRVCLLTDLLQPLFNIWSTMSHHIEGKVKNKIEKNI